MSRRLLQPQNQLVTQNHNWQRIATDKTKRLPANKSRKFFILSALVLLCRYLFVTLLIVKGERCLVANFFWTKILDWAGVGVASFFCPLGFVLCKHFLWLAFQVNKGFLDYRLVFTIAVLHVHHHGDRNTTSNPLN